MGEPQRHDAKSQTHDVTWDPTPLVESLHTGKPPGAGDRLVAAGGCGAEETSSGYFTAVGCSAGTIRLGSHAEAGVTQAVNVLSAPELHTLKRFLSFYLNFSSKK